MRELAMTVESHRRLAKLVDLIDTIRESGLTHPFGQHETIAVYFVVPEKLQDSSIDAG